MTDALPAIELDVRLPANRWNRGTLRVVDRERQVLADMPVLGKADNERAAKAGNPTRDPVRPYGDTPAGSYAPARLELFDRPRERYGRGWIAMEGVDGDALTAKENERSGLYLHAGRGNERLVPTYGCLRVRDIDFDHIAHVCKGRDIVLTVREI